MSYEKQTWNKYDELKTEEENIENGAVVTDNRMNHMETGIGDNDANLASHFADKNNPHKVTAAQVGLDKVDNIKQASKVEFDSHTSDNSNPHKVTAAQIGLDKVDNIQQAAKTDFDSHVNNKANPHSVTASQVGTYTKQEINTKLSKTVMTDDSGKVTIKDLVVTATVKTVNLEITGQSTKTVSIYNGGGQIILTRIGPMVQVDIRSMPAIPANTTISGVIPDGYKPATDYTSITHSNNRLIFYANGSIKPDNNAMVSDNGYYSCSWVTKDAIPTT